MANKSREAPASHQTINFVCLAHIDWELQETRVGSIDFETNHKLWLRWGNKIPIAQLKVLASSARIDAYICGRIFLTCPANYSHHREEYRANY